MEMKKFFCLLLAALMLAGCSDSTDSGSGNSTAAGTSAATTTAAVTTENPDAISGDTVELAGGVKLTSVEGMTGWIANEGSEENGYTKLGNFTQLLDIQFSLTDTKLLNFDKLDTTRQNYTTHEYKGKKVTCVHFANEELEKALLFGAYQYYLPVSDEKTVIMLVSPGGQVRGSHSQKWITKHAELYDSLKNEPEDFLYLLDAVELK